MAALRPRTLAASVVPVLIGSAIAYSDGVFSAVPAVVALTGALLLQVGTNLGNDYYDHLHGADNADRLGRPRASAAGLLEPHRVRNASYAVFVASALVGSYLVVIGGWPIVAIGVASIAAGILYTAGPKPLGYLGLGDILVFVFFGPVAVAGTYYVQALQWSSTALAAGIPVGILAAAILVVNNLRDISTDRLAGKHTLATRIGARATRVQYAAMVLAAFVLLALPYLEGARFETGVWLPLITLPWAAILAYHVLSGVDGAALNETLERTAQLMAAFGILLAVGWII